MYNRKLTFHVQKKKKKKKILFMILLISDNIATLFIAEAP